MNALVQALSARRSLGDRATLATVCLLAVAFDAMSFAYDVVRPAWKAHEHYRYVAVHALLALLIALPLLAARPASPVALMPPDRRIALRGPDPLLTLRAFACLLVLLGHFFAVVFPTKTLAATVAHLPWYQFVVSSPWAGVWIFFSLSGYLMGKGFFAGRYGYDAQGLRRFYTNRLLRIYPVYALAILLVGLLRTPHLMTATNGWSLLQALLFDGSGTGVQLPIGALWSVSTEFQFYLVAPFLALAIETTGIVRRAGAVALLVLLGAGAAVRFVAMHWFGAVWPSTVYMPFGANLDLFLAGMLMAKIVSERHGSRVASSRRMILALAGLPVFYTVISVVGAHSVFRNENWPLYMSFWPAASALVSVAVIYAFETSDLRAVFKATPWAAVPVRWTQMFGILTFCIYVWHEPVFLALRSNLPAMLTASETLQAFVPALGVTLVLALVFYRLVERPFEQMKA